MSAPSNKISPSDAVSKPDKILSRVVLPHPEGPRMVTNSPFLICKLTSSSTCLSPNHLDTCLISMMLPPGSTLFSANAVLYYKVIQHKNVKLSQIWGEDTTKLQLYKINDSFFFIAFSDLKVPPRRKDYGEECELSLQGIAFLPPCSFRFVWIYSPIFICSLFVPFGYETMYKDVISSLWGTNLLCFL